MSHPQHTLTREQIRETFALHRGEAERLAVALGKSATTVSLVLRGRATSKAILDAARVRALELRAQDAAAAGEAA